MSNRIDRVVITGGSSGIGLDLARRFLAEGSSVVINGRDRDKLEEARKSLGEERRVVAVAGHVGEPATARAVAAAARERFGGVDVLVNSAGIFGAKPFLESTVEDLERYFTTNVKGTYLMTQAIVPLMIEGGGGSIVNVGTPLVRGDDGIRSRPRWRARAASSAHGLARAELAAPHPRVNTLASVIRTRSGDADLLASIHRWGGSAVRDIPTDFPRGTVTASLPVDGGYSQR
jgi:NAD(P)-dependent dehydrogenase (short-subunit alcohol dehydrogenase family)